MLSKAESREIATKLLLSIDVTGGITQDRLDKLTVVIENLTEEELGRLHLEECVHGGGDPNRYGKAKKRLGRCAKIGSGGRNPNDERPYQIWAVWA